MSLLRRAEPLLVDVEIVGESFNQPYIREVAKRAAGSDFPIVLVAEPDNPYDPNAVAVMVDGKLVGRLARDMAAVWQPMIRDCTERGVSVVGTGRVYGGTPDKPNLGVFGAAPWYGTGKPSHRWSRLP